MPLLLMFEVVITSLASWAVILVTWMQQSLAFIWIFVHVPVFSEQISEIARRHSAVFGKIHAEYCYDS